LEAQRKVTSFVTRGSGAAAELLVFWHTGAGIQVPAGSVEEGESFEAAAIREAAEESGLERLRLVGRLGVRTFDLPEGRGVLRRDLALQTRPAADAPPSSWVLPRVWVSIVDRRDGFVRVVYQETDADAPEDPIVMARFEGWLPEADLLYRQEREFYHFVADEPAPDRWKTIEGGVHEFHLYWLPLSPKPDVLVGQQQGWLDDFYDDLARACDAKGGDR
jgi:8-oxo-dGTP pyrophosphatase MutT (NUDIX family)